MITKRPPWDVYFLDMAKLASTRSTCLRRNVGAVIVRDRQVISTGYNGAPKGTKHCKTCMRQELGVKSGDRLDLCRASHAEASAIAQAACVGVSTKNAHLFCTHQPCITCLKLIINAGISKVTYLHDYPNSLSDELVKESGLVFEKFIGVE